VQPRQQQHRGVVSDRTTRQRQPKPGEH
jgi:hypothetical protein